MNLCVPVLICVCVCGGGGGGVGRGGVEVCPLADDWLPSLKHLVRRKNTFVITSFYETLILCWYSLLVQWFSITIQYLHGILL